MTGAVIGFFGGTAAGAGSVIATRDAACAELLETFLLNTDLHIIEDDDQDTLLKEVQKWNPNLETRGLIVRNKTDISALIEATETSAYNTGSSVTVKYLIARNLHSTTILLKHWNYTFEYFLNETKRQMDEDVPEFNDAQLRTWRGNKKIDFLRFLLDLQQNIEIISNNYHIRRLYHRVQTLENDLTELRILIEDMRNKANCMSKTKKIDGAASGVKFFGDVASKFPQVNFFVQSAQVVPVVGNILKGVSVLMSAFCYINQNFLS